MTLPPRKQKERKDPKKKVDPRWRSTEHKKFVKEFECVNCGTSRNIEAAHVRFKGQCGMGMTPDDWVCVPLCSSCHRFGKRAQHTIGEPTFWREYHERTGQTVEQLIDALCKASPKAAEIRKERERD